MKQLEIKYNLNYFKSVKNYALIELNKSLLTETALILTFVLNNLSLTL